MTSDPCSCSLIIESRTQEEGTLLRQAYSPFLAWIDPSFKLIKLIKQPRSYKSLHKWTHHRYDHIISSPGVMTSPALSIMLFLHDTGPLSSKRLQQHFATEPWKLHHRVELVNIHSPSLTLADQKFYQAECDTPLWAVCPVEQSNEYLRFNIFVQNFPAMVEFYRVITGVEMETTKDNFCWFQIYSQPGIKIRLGLKHHKCISPVPSQRSGLRFKVKNINNLREVIGTNFRQTAPGCFTVVDPDGNSVYLETGQTHLSILTTLQPFSFQRSTKEVSKGFFEDDCKNKFNKKTSESSDSGRFSDSEAGVSDYKCIRQNDNSNYTFISLSSENQLPDEKLSIHDTDYPNPEQPNLKFKERLVRVLQKSKMSLIEKLIEFSSKKSQSQTFGQITGVKTCQVKSNEPKTIPSRQGHVSVTRGTCNIDRLEKASSSCEFGNNNTNSRPKTFPCFSPASPLESVEEGTADNGFYDQSPSESCKSVFYDDSLMKRKDIDSTFSICNDIKLNTRKNPYETICPPTTIDTDLIDVSKEIFV